MIQLPRREAGRFRAAIRRCVVGRPRGLAPPVTLHQNPQGLTLSAQVGEVLLSLRLARAAETEARLVVPFGVLEAVGANSDELVAIEPGDAGMVRWHGAERGIGVEQSGEAAVPEGEPISLPSSRLRAVDASLLLALHECGKSADAEPSVRFALSRLQLRGKPGEVIGSDGRQLLIWSGFELPFEDDVLVPAIAFFGHREVSGEARVRMGRTADRVVTEVGDWTVALAVAEGRYPDVRSVLPRRPGAARLHLAETDVPALQEALELSITSQNAAPAAFEFGLPTSVVFAATASARSVRHRLPHSESTGMPMRTAIAQRFLLRALRMGLREVHADAPGGTVLFCDERRSYLLACHKEDPKEKENASESDEALAEPVASPQTFRSAPVSGGHLVAHEKNGNSHPPTDSVEEVLDPLTEAEALRTALAEAGRRMGRLLTSLRQFQRQRRALHTAWSSLKNLRLGAKEEA